MNRSDVTDRLATARRKSGLTYEEIAAKLGRSPVWTAAAVLGQGTFDATEAAALLDLLDIGGTERAEIEAILQEPPTKGAVGMTVPTDPLMYRLHEITQIYGPAIKAVIHEQFGDGIMSAIDFQIEISRIPDPKGDRVQLTYNGKFLAYRKW
ncbi:MAG TPA: cyanase [Actinomycetota bacterium]|nr:cyanase [Actinomycetota bacterium]